VLEAFCAVVRATLALHHGYECQERNGIFMVAFPSLQPALEWGLLLQVALMKVEWGPECQLLPNTEEVPSPSSGKPIFRGLRARVGVMHGEVVKICPHTTAGARPPPPPATRRMRSACLVVHRASPRRIHLRDCCSFYTSHLLASSRPSGTADNCSEQAAHRQPS
jgi:hypothetical protein